MGSRRERLKRRMLQVYSKAGFPGGSLPDDDTVCLPLHVWLLNGENIAHRLIPNRKVFIMQQLHVNEKATLSLQAVDIYGNLVDVSFENVLWANSNEAAAVSTVSEDGQTLTLDPAPNGVGMETTVDVTLSINGTPFSAQDQYTLVAGPVSGVSIVTNFNPKEPPPPPSA